METGNDERERAPSSSRRPPPNFGGNETSFSDVSMAAEALVGSAYSGRNATNSDASECPRHPREAVDARKTNDDDDDDGGGDDDDGGCGGGAVRIETERESGSESAVDDPDVVARGTQVLALHRDMQIVYYAASVLSMIGYYVLPVFWVNAGKEWHVVGGAVCIAFFTLGFWLPATHVSVTRMCFAACLAISVMFVNPVVRTELFGAAAATAAGCSDGWICTQSGLQVTTVVAAIVVAPVLQLKLQALSALALKRCDPSSRGVLRDYVGVIFEHFVPRDDAAVSGLRGILWRKLVPHSSKRSVAVRTVFSDRVQHVFLVTLGFVDVLMDSFVVVSMRVGKMCRFAEMSRCRVSANRILILTATDAVLLLYRGVFPPSEKTAAAVMATAMLSTWIELPVGILVATTSVPTALSSTCASGSFLMALLAWLRAFDVANKRFLGDVWANVAKNCRNFPHKALLFAEWMVGSGLGFRDTVSGSSASETASFWTASSGTDATASKALSKSDPDSGYDGSVDTSARSHGTDGGGAVVSDA